MGSPSMGCLLRYQQVHFLARQWQNQRGHFPSEKCPTSILGSQDFTAMWLVPQNQCVNFFIPDPLHEAHITLCCELSPTACAGPLPVGE